MEQQEGNLNYQTIIIFDNPEEGRALERIEGNGDKACNQCFVFCIIFILSSASSTQFIIHYPFPKQQILDPSELKEFADDNSKFDENGRKLSKRVGNTVGKGEIAHYEKFLLFPQCLQKTCTADT